MKSFLTITIENGYESKMVANHILSQVREGKLDTWAYKQTESVTSNIPYHSIYHSAVQFDGKVDKIKDEDEKQEKLNKHLVFDIGYTEDKVVFHLSKFVNTNPTEATYLLLMGRLAEMLISHFSCAFSTLRLRATAPSKTTWLLPTK